MEHITFLSRWRAQTSKSATLLSVISSAKIYQKQINDSAKFLKNQNLSLFFQYPHLSEQCQTSDRWGNSMLHIMVIVVSDKSDMEINGSLINLNQPALY